MLYTKLKHRAQELKEFVDLGVIDPKWIRDLEIFEEFHALEKRMNCRMCRYEYIADKRNLSSELVRKAIRVMGN